MAFALRERSDPVETVIHICPAGGIPGTGTGDEETWKHSEIRFTTAERRTMTASLPETGDL